LAASFDGIFFDISPLSFEISIQFSKEAVMAVYKYKDGKIISFETGATKLTK
jgi:hypothetical protein